MKEQEREPNLLVCYGYTTCEVHPEQFPVGENSPTEKCKNNVG